MYVIIVQYTPHVAPCDTSASTVAELHATYRGLVELTYHRRSKYDLDSDFLRWYTMEVVTMRGDRVVTSNFSSPKGEDEKFEATS